MRKYPEENWKRLGEWVGDQRRQAGYTATTTWAAKVGRSSRVVLGLERGEPAGDKTIRAVATALGLDTRPFYRILAGDNPWPETRADLLAELEASNLSEETKALIRQALDTNPSPPTNLGKGASA